MQPQRKQARPNSRGIAQASRCLEILETAGGFGGFSGWRDRHPVSFKPAYTEFHKCAVEIENFFARQPFLMTSDATSVLALKRLPDRQKEVVQSDLGLEGLEVLGLLDKLSRFSPTPSQWHPRYEEYLLLKSEYEGRLFAYELRRRKMSLREAILRALAHHGDIESLHALCRVLET